jgi:hypothetical protein
MRSVKDLRQSLSKHRNLLLILLLGCLVGCWSLFANVPYGPMMLIYAFGVMVGIRFENARLRDAEGYYLSQRACRKLQKLYEKDPKSFFNGRILRVAYLGLLVACLNLVVGLNDAEACNRCHYSACGGCQKVATAYGYDIVQRPDGSLWRAGVEVEYLRVLRGGVWIWDYFAKRGKDGASANAYAYANAGQYFPANAQGSTVYGYGNQTETYRQPSASVFAQALQPDVNLALQIIGRNLDNTKDLQTQALGSVKTLGEQGITVAAINALGQADAIRIQAATPKTPEKVERTITLSVGPGGARVIDGQNGGGTVQAFGSPSLTGRQVVNNRCLQCHSGADSKGGLNLDVELTADDYRQLLPRIMSDHPDKPRMPLDKNGKPGPALSAQEFAAIWEASQGPGPSE